jgi:hypothetical protein
MSGVRQFAEADIPEVADLHRRVFGIADRGTPEMEAAYRSYFLGVLLNHPGPRKTAGPLVYEDNGRVTGFLGIVPRPMRFKDRAVVAAVSSQFIVDKSSRGLPGLQLQRALLDGPQDLILADESADEPRMLFERMGGATSVPHSIHWYFPVRPARFALGRNPILQPLTSAGDFLATKVPRSPFRIGSSSLVEQPLTPSDVTHFHEASPRALVPDYDAAYLTWLLDRARSLTLHGDLQSVLLTTPDKQRVGCFLYYRSTDRYSDVIHFAAAPRFARQVLDHMFQHARRNGVRALAGRVPPEHLSVFSAAQCILHPRMKWTLVHSRDPELLAAVCRGDAELSPLDGEWCCHFNYTGVSG